MTNVPDRTFTSDFKQFFLRGLGVLLPSVLTLWLVVQAYRFVDSSIATPINTGIQYVMVQVADIWPNLEFDAFKPTPQELDNLKTENGIRLDDESRDGKLRNEVRAAKIKAWWDDRWYMQLFGLVVALVAVYVTGRLVGGFLGRRIYRRIEALITSLPVFKQVYPHVKQIVDFLFTSDRPIKFSRVVAAEYPRKGIWSVGFLTGATLRSIERRSGDAVTVFIPSSPTPFTGYTITVPRKDTIDLPITVEEAIRFAVSGGVLVPEHQLGGEDGENGPPSGLIPIPAPPDDEDETDDDETEPRRDAG